jgi:hypothetical protein
MILKSRFQKTALIPNFFVSDKYVCSEEKEAKVDHSATRLYTMDYSVVWPQLCKQESLIN